MYRFPTQYTSLYLTPLFQPFCSHDVHSDGCLISSVLTQYLGRLLWARMAGGEHNSRQEEEDFLAFSAVHRTSFRGHSLYHLTGSVVKFLCLFQLGRVSTYDCGVFILLQVKMRTDKCQPVG